MLVLDYGFKSEEYERNAQIKQAVPPFANEVKAAKRYLTEVMRPGRYPRGSYELKHMAEDWAGEYISNGALIAAAVDLRYRVTPAGINAVIFCHLDD